MTAACPTQGSEPRHAPDEAIGSGLMLRILNSDGDSLEQKLPRDPAFLVSS